LLKSGFSIRHVVFRPMRLLSEKSRQEENFEFVIGQSLVRNNEFQIKDFELFVQEKKTQIN